MLCRVCREGLQGIWDPSKTKRVCRIDEFQKDKVPLQENKFVIVERYSSAQPCDPKFFRPEHYMFGHHLTRQSFEQSVSDGCVMCEGFSFNRWGNSQDLKLNPRIAALGYYSLFSIVLDDFPNMFLYVNDSEGGFELTRYAGRDVNMNLDISPSTGDYATWAIIQCWLETCMQSHDRCSERASAAFVPTRLLRLETSAELEPSFRVVHANEVEPDARYVTLTHGYGIDNGDLRLTESTLARFSNLQPLSVLPLAFRDALDVVSRVGLSHLWIDRFCILQDNPADQLVEAGKCNNVFRNAFLSIAASSTASPSSGLFVGREPTLVAPTVFDLPVSAEGATVPYYSSLEVRRGWAHAFRNDSLSRSASAVQERLLAPRVVHFGSKMVFWECHDIVCAETHPRGVNEAMIGTAWAGEEMAENPSKTRRYTRPWKMLLNAPVWRMLDDPIDQVFADWLTVLVAHSDCTLAAPEEKLLTLAGIAAEMKVLLRDRGCEDTEYLAGMWKAMLPRGLLWNLRGSGSRPAAYRAPSWSWAAVDGSLCFHDTTPQGDNGLLCQVVSASTTPRAVDETGEVMAGSIVLKGKLILGKLHPHLPSLHLGRPETVLIQSLVNAEGDAVLVEPEANSPSGYNCHWAVLFDTKEDMGLETLCLPVRTKKWANLGCNVYGLALSRLDDGRYVRRGLWVALVDTVEEALGVFKDLPEREIELV